MTSSPDDFTDSGDPTFAHLHGRPPAGWVNDPNGCGRIDGTWHVFYQHNPAAPTHGQIHWGHMSSVDLVHWRTEPIALAPRPGGPDAAGCWTGCLVDDAGVPTLVYTGVTADSDRSAVVLARSDRTLQHFTRDEPPAAGMPRDRSLTAVRDPHVFTFAGRRYAVQGAGRPGGVGQILLYGCDDLTRWTELGTLLTADHPVVAEIAAANIWECPNLIKIGADWVLIVSSLASVDGRHQLLHVSWVIGELTASADGLRFAPRSSGRLDHGPAFYAPQVAIDPDGGRAVLWGWSWELDRTDEQVAAVGWQGVLTFPRELSVADDRVVARPVPELIGLRTAPTDPAALPAAFELVVDPPRPVGLELDGVAVWPGDLTVDRVLVDGSLVEVFTADGDTFTTRAYPTTGSTWRLTGDLTGVSTYRLAR